MSTKLDKAKKWLKKGLDRTDPSKSKLFVTRGRSRKKRTVVAASAMGAIHVGFAGTNNHRKIRNKRQGHMFFWDCLNELYFDYYWKYGSPMEQDNLCHGRDFVVQRIYNLR